PAMPRTVTRRPKPASEAAYLSTRVSAVTSLAMSSSTCGAGGDASGLLGMKDSGRGGRVTRWRPEEPRLSFFGRRGGGGSAGWAECIGPSVQGLAEQPSVHLAEGLLLPFPGVAPQKLL